MTNTHKWAKEMQHWAAGGIVQHRYLELTTWKDCDKNCVDFGSTDEFRIKTQLKIPKTRIKFESLEIDYLIMFKNYKDYTELKILLKEAMIRCSQESLRLAVEHGDLIIPEKKNG